jgi:tRNA(Ile)-lysidine synthase
LGSARVSRAGDCVSRAGDCVSHRELFLWRNDLRDVAVGKDCFGETPKPARETRALPGTAGATARFDDNHPRIASSVEMKARDFFPLLKNELPRDFPTTSRYLIGVSGGRDSIALVNILTDLGYKKLIVCHLNHQLRGVSSRADARFVEKIARHLGLDCEVGSTDVGALARRSKLSIETAARFARFAFFVEVARRRRCSMIFLAHHADDLVETVLLNLFRGSSPGGMAAMRRISIHRVGKSQLTILRPLLGTWRSAIDAYVSTHGLEFRDDATNRMLGASRNKIRHRILPNIEKQFGRDVRKTIWRAAQIWSEEEGLLDSLVATEMISTAQLAVTALREMPVALQRRTIVSWLRARKIADVSFDVVESVRSLIEPGTKTAKVNLPRNQHARRREGKIFLE